MIRISSYVIAGCLLLALSQTAFGQQTKMGSTLAPDKYDQWGDIRVEDEIVRLDKIANQLKEWRLSIVYLVIHAGQKACNGEAKARGIRAQNHLLKREIEPERIVWIDAGWRKQLAVEVWIWPPQLGRPKISTNNTLKRNQVTIERNCKIKYRGPA